MLILKVYYWLLIIYNIRIFNQTFIILIYFIYYIKRLFILFYNIKAYL